MIHGIFILSSMSGTETVTDRTMAGMIASAKNNLCENSAQQDGCRLTNQAFNRNFHYCEKMTSASFANPAVIWRQIPQFSASASPVLPQQRETRF
jgi:hypothetical protein